jgi:branched-chain amino acid transport system substrate-binding protein
VTYKVQPDVYAVQGYDAAATLAAGLTAVKGDFAKRDAMVAAMRKAQIDSPRGKYTLSRSTTRCRTSTSARSRAART